MIGKGGLLSLILCILLIDTGIPDKDRAGPVNERDGAGIENASVLFSDASYPTRTNMSSFVVATSTDPYDPYYAVAQALANYRNGIVLEFDPSDLPALMEDLKAAQARHVAVVVKPMEMDINFNRAFIMNSTTMDEDPFPDFSWGYITGPTADEAMDFVENIIKAESEGVQDLPLDISGYSVSVFNAKYTSTSSFSQYVVDDYIDLYLEENDTGSGREYFLSHTNDLEGRKIIDISGNGDPHMTWLFEGGNFDPVPPVWPYDPAKIEDPANARMGITPENLSGIDLYPAVMFSGTCHSGVPKRALIEGDIAATFGDTGWTARFYNMSDDFSFFNRIIRNNVTGYFAPIGANHGYTSIYDQWNALRFHEPLGDIQKRSMDQVVMGFMGNRPNLRLYNEGEWSGDDIFASGTFDPDDWPSAASMLGGKANRVYYGDPLYDPFKNDHDPRLNLTKVSYDYVNDTTMEMTLSYHRPSALEAWFPNWDMFHYGEDWFYEAVDLPLNYSDPLSVNVVREDPSLQRFHVMEEIDGRTRLHVEADLQSVGYIDDTWYNITYRLTRENPFIPVYGLSVTPDEIEGHALPGERATFNISVENIGNVPQTVTVFHSEIPDDWTLDMQFNGTLLDPQEVRNATVTIGVPSNALFNTSTVTTILFRSHGSDYSVNITTRVNRTYGVDLFSPESEYVVPLWAMSIPFSIVNTGNWIDDFNIEISHPDRWNITFAFDGSNLIPGSIKNGTINVTAPLGSKVNDSVMIDVIARSSGDPTMIDRMNLSLTVKRIEVVIIEPPSNRTILPEGKNKFNLTAKNVGTVDSVVRISFQERRYSSTITGPEELPLDVGEEKTLEYEITVSSKANAGSNVTIMVFYNLLSNPKSHTIVEFNLTFGTVYGLDVISDRSELILGPDQNATINLTISNLGNADIEVTLSVDSNASFIFDLSTDKVELGPYQSEEIHITIVPGSVGQGDYDYTILASDGRNENTIPISISYIEPKEVDDVKNDDHPNYYLIILFVSIALITVVLIVLSLFIFRRVKDEEESWE